MVCRQVWGPLALSLALAGCSSFVEAESGPGGGDTPGSGGTTDSTDPTLSPSTSGMTSSATSGTTTTPSTSNAETETTIDSTTDPSESETTDSVTSNTTGGSGETTGPGDGTTGPGTETTEGEESTGTQPCVQADIEDNDSFDGRQFLDPQVCEASPTTFTGTLLNGADVDRFQFDSPWTEKTCGTGEPDHLYVPDGPIELCASPGCESGSGSFLCEEGTLTDVNGFNYCCSTGPVRLDIFCAGTDETSAGYLVIRSDGTPPVCAEYSFTYAVEFESN